MEMNFEEWAVIKGMDLTKDLQGDYIDESTYFACAGWMGCLGEDDPIYED